jgi:hypothetical protein
MAWKSVSKFGKLVNTKVPHPLDNSPSVHQFLHMEDLKKSCHAYFLYILVETKKSQLYLYYEDFLDMNPQAIIISCHKN